MKKFFALVLAMMLVVGMASVAFAGDVDLKSNTAYVLKFNCKDNVEISFGDDGSEGVFTFNASGQGKLFMAFDTEPNEAIAAANEGKELFFVNFSGIKFNRTGEYVYELEGAAAAYEVVDGKLVEIPGVKIENDEISFRTNTLKRYVFAKCELVNP